MDELLVQSNHIVQRSLFLDMLTAVQAHLLCGDWVSKQVDDAIGNFIDVAGFHGESIPLVVDGFGYGADSSAYHGYTA